jgi:hypothetical protein
LERHPQFAIYIVRVRFIQIKMKIESFKWEGVKADGAVETKGKIVMSQDNGGCGIDTCHCSDGHWLTIVKPRTEDGIVEGLKVKFENKSEMEEFFKSCELVGVS